MLDLEVIDDADVARSMLDPARARVLRSLFEPGSASTIAAKLNEPRQKVNYHLRALETHGLVRFVEEIARRGLTERVMQASARSYLLSPVVLGASAGDPTKLDRLSTRYLIAVAARIVREVAALSTKAEGNGKLLATLTIDTELRFASAADREAFTTEMGNTVIALTRKYHSESAPGGRWHRLIVAAHPRPTSNRSAIEEAK